MTLKGHLRSTRNRSDEASGRLLVLHGVTEFSYHREDTPAIGKLHQTVMGVDPKRAHPSANALQPAEALKPCRDGRGSAAGIL